MLKFEMLCHEVRLRKALDEEKTLRRLHDEREVELAYLQCEVSHSLNYESYLKE